MKRYFVAAALVCASPAFAQSVPVEEDARICCGLSRGLIDPAVALIEAHGWRCDSISAMTPFLTARGFSVDCNHFSYRYNIEDRGGNWEVSLD